MDDDALTFLLATAEQLGATKARIISPDLVSVEDTLADFCLHPQCPFWGQSLSCPPYVGGPEEFRRFLKECRYVLVVRLEIQACSLLGEERPEVMRLLHELVAALEIKARQNGFSNAAGFAGGSCKPCFCADQPDCRAVTTIKKCRYPNQARPSLSGYGVNVGKLMESAGWSGDLFTQENDEQEQFSWIAGLILLS